MNKLFGLILIILLGSCVSSKKIAYSYKIDSFIIDTSKHFFSSMSLISYNDYLFEFKKRKIFKDVVSLSSGKKEGVEYYDTMGVYILSKDRRYYDIDTFTLEGKIVKSGKFEDKEYGVKLNSYINSDTFEEKNVKLYDTMINSIQCFYADINKNQESTIQQRIILIKNRYFNSYYKINGELFFDNNYCVVGSWIYDFKIGKGVIEEISRLRVLSSKERQVCESLIKKVENFDLPKIK